MKIKLKHSEITKQICHEFTIDFKNEYEFKEHTLQKEDLPDFSIGFITGTSGSGKSLLLKTFGEPENIIYNEDDAVASHFKNYKEAAEKLQAVGFNSITQWLLPRRALSQGQGYRVDLAMQLKSGMISDEFTSTIDRNTALGLSNSIQRYIREKNLKNIVLAGVHKDVIPFLKPDWIYCTDTRKLTISLCSYDITDLDKKEFRRKPFMTL